MGDTVKTFTGLKQGTKTPRFVTNRTYGYCYTRIILETNDTITLRPIDFVGEKLYKRGKIKMSFDIYKNRLTNKKYISPKTRRQL